MRFSIVEEQAVTAVIGRAYSEFERTDDAISALYFELERNPKGAGFEIEDRPGCYWLMRVGKPSIKYPKITAVYMVQADQITISSLRIEHGGVIFHSSIFEKGRK